MRLKVAVQRHGLPVVRLLFNADTDHTPGKHHVDTVADLLTAINELVPLESADGQWGLEDYTVQVNGYECLHYQEANDVLREDDEVVIRSLSTVELRERRGGGRLQITTDGRHLIDGACWGKRRRPGDRPGVFIPPRKKPRLLEDVPDDAIPQVPALPESPGLQRLIEESPRNGDEPSQALVRFVEGDIENGDNEDDDDEDDEDWNQEDYDSDDESVEDDGEEEEEEDLSQADEDESEGQLNRDGARELQNNEGLHDLATRRHNRSEETRRFLRVNGVLGSAQKSHQKSSKSKSWEEGDADISFQGFSSPAKTTPQKTGKSPRVPSWGEYAVARLGRYVVEQEHAGQKDQQSSEPAESEEDPEEATRQTNGSADQANGDKNTAHGDSDTSSSDCSSESSDDESSSGIEVDDASSSASNYTSSSEDDSSSDSSSESGDSSSTDSSPANSALSGTKATNEGKSNRVALFNEGASEATPAVPSIVPQQIKQNTVNVPPGQGSSRTRGNNKRKKMNKIMRRLKDEGKLPEDANFEQLRAYLASEEPRLSEAVHKNTQEAKTGQELTDEMNARKEAIFARLNTSPNSEVGADHPLDEQNGDGTQGAETNARKDIIEEQFNRDPTSRSPPSFGAASARSIEEATASESAALQQTPRETVIQEPAAESAPAQEESTAEAADEEPSPKRTRLDVASSRRMLFGALGVRNPKTPAAEQALREKLAKPTRQIKAREVKNSTDNAEAAELLSDDRWKQKLTVAAVECVNKNKAIETPPFPFKHPWQVRREKEEERRSSKYPFRQKYDYSKPTAAEVPGASELEVDQEITTELPEEQPEEFDDQQDGGQGQNHPSPVLTTPHTLSTGAGPQGDDMAIPEKFDQLPDLTESDLVEGACVAYKELHINERIEPEQTPYRVAWIMANDGDNNLELLLAAPYRKAVERQYDEETGERVYSRFEVPVEQEETDNGLRELAFSQMILPKLVMASPKKTLVDDSLNGKDKASGEPTAAQQNGQGGLRGGFLAGSAESRVPETQHDLDTPRRNEINSIIKDAGFESALDHQLLKPLAGPSAVGNDRADEGRHPPNEDAAGTHNDSHEWRSSPRWASSAADPPSNPASVRESSVPSESMVESVRYPNLSQLELATPLVQVQSSSHQDAQRVTPCPDADTSVVLKSPLQAPNEDNCGSLQSEATTQTSPQQLGKSAQLPNTSVPSSLASGFDGAMSPRREYESDSESIDSNGFPSLRTITSSQIRRQTDKPVKQSSESKPTRRSPRINRTTASTSDWSDSEPSLKASQSQKLRLGQIPENPIIVDLTQTSTESTPAKPSNSKAATWGKGVSSSSQAAAVRRSFEGLGEKSYLKRKKRSL